ncbi:cache domain-containing protein, partial [bacterium AH-315-N14]|nr:cache domain-containing protein [bacterium AH-315-N14]
MNFFKNLSFRRKLVLSYIIIIIVPVTVLGLYSYNQSKTYLEEQVQRHIESSTKQMISDINYRLQWYNNLIKVTIYNPKVKKILSYKDAISLEEMQGLNDYVEPMLYNFLIGNRDIKKLTIFTEDGKPISGD